MKVASIFALGDRGPLSWYSRKPPSCFSGGLLLRFSPLSPSPSLRGTFFSFNTSRLLPPFPPLNPINESGRQRWIGEEGK